MRAHDKHKSNLFPQKSGPLQQPRNVFMFMNLRCRRVPLSLSARQTETAARASRLFMKLNRKGELTLRCVHTLLVLAFSNVAFTLRYADALFQDCERHVDLPLLHD